LVFTVQGAVRRLWSYDERIGPGGGNLVGCWILGQLGATGDWSASVKVSGFPNLAQVCWDSSVNNWCKELCVNGGNGALPALSGHCPVVCRIQSASEGCEWWFGCKVSCATGTGVHTQEMVCGLVTGRLCLGRGGHGAVPACWLACKVGWASKDVGLSTGKCSGVCAISAVAYTLALLHQLRELCL